MARVDSAEFRFTATVHTTRREVLYALRALSMAAQRTVSNKKPWSGVTDDLWAERHHHATFRFTSREYLNQFHDWATEILKPGTWDWVGEGEDP